MKKERALELIAADNIDQLKVFLASWMDAHLEGVDPDDDNEDGIDLDSRFFYSEVEALDEEGAVNLGVRIAKIDRGPRYNEVSFEDVFEMSDVDTDEVLGLFCILGVYSSWDRPEYDSVHIVYERQVVHTAYLSAEELLDPDILFYEGE